MEGFWSLTFFTVLAQASVGMALFSMCRNDIAPRSGILLSAFIICMGGLLASVTHLSAPLHGPYALTNFTTSWLSREIIGMSAFSGLLFLSLLTGNKALRTLTGLMGLVLLHIMGGIYSRPTMTYWGGWVVYATFLTTTFVLGASTLLFFRLREQKDTKEMAQVLKGPLPLLLLLGIIARFIVSALQVIKADTSFNTCLFTIHLILFGLAAILLLCLYLKSIKTLLGSSTCATFIPTTIVILLLVWAGEFLGRVLFFTLYTPFGA